MMSGPVLASTAPPRFAQPIGWPLLPVPGDDGRIAWPDLASSVRQRLEVIMRTAPGEQLMHPEFGAGLEGVLHQPNSSVLRAQLQERLEAHIAAYEPRIMIDALDVMAGDDDRALIVSLAYRLRANGLAAQINVRVPVGGG